MREEIKLAIEGYNKEKIQINHQLAVMQVAGKFVGTTQMEERLREIDACIAHLLTPEREGGGDKKEV